MAQLVLFLFQVGLLYIYEWLGDPGFNPRSFTPVMGLFSSYGEAKTDAELPLTQLKHFSS